MELTKEELEALESSPGTKEEGFHFFIPMEKAYIEKALNSKDSKDPKSWKIGGYASSSDTDLEGESIDPYGIDTAYFLKHGYFNDDHQKGAAHKVGIPTEAFVDAHGLYVRGYLLKDIPEAQGIYRLMQTLAKGEHNRQVGFSVEGKVLEQQGGRILRCWVKDIAITANPVNTKTYAELIKSLKEKQTSVITEPDLIKKDKMVEKSEGDKIEGGLADKKKESDFDKGALEQGIAVEMEHTNDREVAKEIAMDHLTEDPRYYDALAKMEQKLESTKGNSPKLKKIMELASNISKEAQSLIEDSVSIDKGLEAGHNTNSATATNGEALRHQDLDNELKVTTNSEKEDPEIVEYTMKKSGIDDIETVKKIIQYAEILKNINNRQ